MEIILISDQNKKPFVIPIPDSQLTEDRIEGYTLLLSRNAGSLWTIGQRTELRGIISRREKIIETKEDFYSQEIEITSKDVSLVKGSPNVATYDLVIYNALITPDMGNLDIKTDRKNIIKIICLP